VKKVEPTLVVGFFFLKEYFYRGRIIRLAIIRLMFELGHKK